MFPALQPILAAGSAKARLAWAALRRHPWRAALVPPALVVLYVLVLIPFTPGIGDLRKAKVGQPSLLLASDGSELAQYKQLNREWVPLDQIASNAVNALIAIEDRRFFQHHGIDFRRTAGALLATVQGNMQGGSTITQQLARNLFPDEIGRAASITRKLKEAITALKIEAVYSKPEILETYLNTVPFLYNAFGIEMAARTYFDKSAVDLDVLESATLIGMLKGTSYYNPVLNPERARERRNLVLAQMARDGTLDPAQLETLSRKPLGLDFERQVSAPGPAAHVAQQVRKWLVAWADDKGYNIHVDGLRIVTTVDAGMQKAANGHSCSAWPTAASSGARNRRRCKPAFWRWTRAAARCGPGWAAVTSQANSSTTSARRGASRARPSSPSSMGRPSCRDSRRRTR
jgi:penicillin-binding protein 1A